MKKVALRISRLPNAAAGLRKRLPFSVADGQELLLESSLPADAPLNDHLVWMWGLLKHERRYLKSLQNEGAQFTIVAPFRTGGVEILPNGAELLHLLGVTLTIGAK
jgi:hypothetical protein